MVSLLWTGRPSAARGPKPALSLERIVAEAISLADAEGLAAVSMKTLATRLGAGTMSLYRYLPGKDELVALMLDSVIGAPPAVLRDGGWRDGLRLWAHGTRDVFHRHPWSIGIIGQPREIGPNEVAWGEAALGILAAAGAPDHQILDMVFAVNAYVRGASQLSAPGGLGPTVDPEDIVASGRIEEFPQFARLMAAAPDFDPTASSSFDVGLGYLLDGISATLTA